MLSACQPCSLASPGHAINVQRRCLGLLVGATNTASAVSTVVFAGLAASNASAEAAAAGASAAASAASSAGVAAFSVAVRSTYPEYKFQYSHSLVGRCIGTLLKPCVSRRPPGFRFWQGTSSVDLCFVCAMLSDHADIDEWSDCPAGSRTEGRLRGSYCRCCICGRCSCLGALREPSAHAGRRASCLKYHPESKLCMPFPLPVALNVCLPVNLKMCPQMPGSYLTWQMVTVQHLVGMSIELGKLGIVVCRPQHQAVRALQPLAFQGHLHPPQRPCHRACKFCWQNAYFRVWRYLQATASSSAGTATTAIPGPPASPAAPLPPVPPSVTLPTSTPVTPVTPAGVPLRQNLCTCMRVSLFARAGT